MVQLKAYGLVDGVSKVGRKLIHSHERNRKLVIHVMELVSVSTVMEYDCDAAVMDFD